MEGPGCPEKTVPCVRQGMWDTGSPWVPPMFSLLCTRALTSGRHRPRRRQRQMQAVYKEQGKVRGFVRP